MCQHTTPIFLAKSAKEKVICDRSQARRQTGDMCYEIEDEYAHHIPRNKLNELYEPYELHELNELIF